MVVAKVLRLEFVVIAAGEIVAVVVVGMTWAKVLR